MKKVLLIDSGSGGVNVLKECLKECPCCDFLLFCDNANLPYGNKDKEQLIGISLKNLRTMYQFFKFEIVIFACNTLTAVCLKECEKSFSEVEFIGTVPPIKTAMERFERDEILVLATLNTQKNNRDLKSCGCEVLSVDNLASVIDENLDKLEVVQPLLEKVLSRFRGKVKAVVLGCTHYAAVKDLIVQILGEIVFFDGATSVAEKLKEVVLKNQKDGLKTNENGVVLPNYQLQIMTSGSNEMRNKFLWWLNRE